jgi:hypothetical protein
MPIKGFSSRGTNAASWIRWNHNTGVWSGWGNDNIDFTGVLADFKCIRIGQGLLEKGETPRFVWSATLDSPGPRPGKGWRRGIGLRLLFPDGLMRELKTTSVGLCDIFIKIYDEFELTAEFVAGQMPVIDQIGVAEAEVNGDRIYDPILKITGSRPCPVEFSTPPEPEEAVASKAEQSSSRALALAADKELDDDVPF